MIPETSLPEVATAYVRDALQHGGPLSSRVLDRRVIAGSFTFLPPETPLDRVMDFDAGGHWTSTESPWKEWLDAWVSRAPGRIAIAEDYLRERGSPLLEEEAGYVACGEAILLFADGSAANPVDRLLRGMSRYPSIVFLCSTTLRPARGSSLTSHELESLAETADLVLVGAYDEESFVASHLAAGRHADQVSAVRA